MNQPTDPRTLEALRRDREAPAPDEARARVAARLGVTVSGGGPRPLEPSPERALPRSREAAPSVEMARTGVARSAAMLAGAFLAGAAAGVLLHARWTNVSAARVASPSAPATPAAAPPSGSVTSPAAPIAPKAMDPSPPALAAPTAAVSPAGAPSRPRLQPLDAERALLDSARAALVAGDSGAALNILDRYAKLYHRPLLGEEHDAIRVQALVHAGRYEEARSRAAELRRKAPQSLLLPAVDAAIASIP